MVSISCMSIAYGFNIKYSSNQTWEHGRHAFGCACFQPVCNTAPQTEGINISHCQGLRQVKLLGKWILAKFSSKFYIICFEKCQILKVRQVKFVNSWTVNK